MPPTKRGRSSASRSAQTQQLKLSDSIWNFIMAPSRLMDDVLIGRIKLEDQPDAVQSACRLVIYEQACKILDLETKIERRAAIARTPEKLRPHIEKEVMRVWRTRSDES